MLTAVNLLFTQCALPENPAGEEGYDLREEKIA